MQRLSDDDRWTELPQVDLVGENYVMVLGHLTRVAELVWRAHNGPLAEDQEVIHIGDEFDDSLDNLELHDAFKSNATRYLKKAMKRIRKNLQPPMALPIGAALAAVGITATTVTGAYSTHDGLEVIRRLASNSAAATAASPQATSPAVADANGDPDPDGEQGNEQTSDGNKSENASQSGDTSNDGDSDRIRNSPSPSPLTPTGPSSSPTTDDSGGGDGGSSSPPASGPSAAPLPSGNVTPEMLDAARQLLEGAPDPSFDGLPDDPAGGFPIDVFRDSNVSSPLSSAGGGGGSPPLGGSQTPVPVISVTEPSGGMLALLAWIGGIHFWRISLMNSKSRKELMK